jgi:hypothetical protein
MSKINRVILKNTEIFNGKKFKISADLKSRSNLLQSSWLDGVDDITVQEKGLNTQATQIYIDENTKRNISEINDNINDVESINEIRNPNYSFVQINNDITLEKIPVHTHITETLTNFKRMANEYPLKLSRLIFLRDNLFDTEYASLMYKLGRANLIPLDQNGRIYSDSSKMISGYFKAENAPPNISANIVLRGVPVPMRRTETSSGNYIFTYPQYLVDNIELVESIQYIEVLNSLENTEIYFGTSYVFENFNATGYQTSANLNIINKPFRNITSDGN